MLHLKSNIGIPPTCSLNISTKKLYVCVTQPVAAASDSRKL